MGIFSRKNKEKDIDIEKFDFEKTAVYFDSHRAPKKENFLVCPDWLRPEYDDPGNYEEEPDKMFLLCDPFLQRQFYKEGQPAMGAIVQANVDLFKRGREDLPANYIYSTDSYYIEKPEELLKLASALFETKGDRGYHPSIQKLADLLADEYETIFAYKLPRQVTEGRNVYFTTVLVCRNHLPKGKIINRVMPMIVLEGNEPDAMVMPHWYWMV